MKTIKFIYTGIFCFAITCLTSCELAQDIDEFEPLFALSATEAIVDEASAELALTGIYSGFRQRSTSSGNPDIYLIPGFLSGLADPGGAPFSDEETGYINNNPVPDRTSSNLGAYTRMYDIVNRCNWLLQEIDDAEFDNPSRKVEIIAEAKAVRAIAYFYLLRLWGQFYDVNSVYGLDLRTEPSFSNEAFPRVGVSDVYALIIADLDEAIANAPDLRAKFFTNKTFAKALKAKVMLYQGNYSEASNLAQDVINNAGASFALASTFDEIFDNDSPGLFDSSEVVFGTKGEPGAGIGLFNFWRGFSSTPTFSYIDMAANGTIDIGGQIINYDGGRVASNFALGAPVNKYGTYEMIYHLRMAEVYLILAEADARANNSVTTVALDALNAVRIRAGATTTGANGFETYPATISLSQFLEVVRIEKLMELGAEQGEEWFDLVRYDYADGFGSGFQVSDVKATATDSDKFILPIASESIEAGGGVVEQNPGY